MALVADGPAVRVHAHEDAIAMNRRHREIRPASVGIVPVVRKAIETGPHARLTGRRAPLVPLRVFVLLRAREPEMAIRIPTSSSPARHRRRPRRARSRLLGAIATTALASTAAAETWRGLVVVPEHRYSAYDQASDYAYESTAMEPKVCRSEPTSAGGTTKDPDGGGDVFTRQDDNRNGRITRKEALRHGIAPYTAQRGGCQPRWQD